MKDFRQIGGRIVFGIDFEYTKSEWDGFCRKLTDFVKKHIGNDAASSIRIYKEEYANKHLCFITVPKGKVWHYRDGKYFFVRRENSTEPLEGKDADSYKKQNPR